MATAGDNERIARDKKTKREHEESRQRRLDGDKKEIRRRGEEYTRGSRRVANPAGRKVDNAMAAARERGDRATARKLRQQRRGLPYGDPRDPGYRRLRYIRYADDHLLGFTGPKAEAEEIKQRLARFLRDELKLELSADKTLITHARTQKARFLGYDIIAQHSATRPAVNGVIGLRVPREVITARQAPYLVHGTPWYRPGLLNLDDLQIVSTYGQEYRGLVQYYLLAGNVHELDRLHRTAQVSMLKTLACKHRSTVTKMARKYKATIATELRAACLLRGPQGAAGQEAAGRTVRRHPAQTAAQGGHRRPPARPADPPQGAGHPAPEGRMRMVRPAGRGGNPPGPQAGRPHPGGAAATPVGGLDGENAAQDAHRLRTLPPGHPRREASRDLHVNIAGEPDALKGARPVRTGGRRKRTCTTGTSPAAYRCYYLAEAAGLEVWLVNARDVKHLPGRGKSDTADCVWHCKLNERGMLRRSFVPPEPVRDLRALTRTRARLAQDQARHQARVEKILEDAPAEDLGGDLGPVRGQRPPVPRCPGRRGTQPGGAGRARRPRG